MLKIDLNGQWDLRLDAEENGLAEEWARNQIKSEYKVNVPGCVQQLDELCEAYPPHNDMRNGYLGTFFEETVFDMPALDENKRTHLYIGGVGPTCHIWINGRYVTKNIFGLCHIYEDISDYVIAGENRLTVAVTEQYASLITGERFSGMNWSGIFSACYVEIGGAVEIKNEYISFKNGKASAVGEIKNCGEDFDGKITVDLGRNKTEKGISLKKGESKTFSIEVDAENLPRWSYRNPALVDVKITCGDTEKCFKTGLREISVQNDRILINGLPTFFKGTGSEYYSPTISPLTDVEIINKRYDALKKYGFNFYRCHTHIPTEEEMCIADQAGIMLDVEFGLVSNFDKTTPIEQGMEMWKKFILQSRKHPSVLVYCIGNEGSQLMVDSVIERNRAKMGYRIIKENTDNQLGIIAFGMQGELPELPNDFETPHLWSENFLWSYDGLTDIPWEDLGRTTGGKPCVIHEYGKFGVWPSRKEEKDCTVKGGIKLDHGTQSYEWLKEKGLTELEPNLLENSRKAANRFNRIILEDARRQPYVSGYALWTFFRRAKCNAGLSDDLGINLNGECGMFADGCNAEVALLMDRGFQNRAFACGIPQKIEISVSNFSEKTVKGQLYTELLCGDEIIAKSDFDCDSAVGTTAKAAVFEFTAAGQYSNKKLLLKVTLKSGEKTVSKNMWEFWAFDTAPQADKVYLHIDDITLFRAVKKIFPNAQRLSSVDSIIIGCRSWRDPKLAETAAKSPETLIISDMYDEVIKNCVKNGNRVMLLDSGKLPDDWMLPPICKELGERDTGRFYTSFRAGWDKGNLVTLVKNDKILGSFPNEGFCDLHYYDLMQSARIMKPDAIEAAFGSKSNGIIESFSKIPAVQEAKSIVQDPNAIKEQSGSAARSFNAREQGYLIKVGKNLTLCTLKLADNPAGIGLLKNLIK